MRAWGHRQGPFPIEHPFATLPVMHYHDHTEPELLARAAELGVTLTEHDDGHCTIHGALTGWHRNRTEALFGLRGWLPTLDGSPGLMPERTPE